jgi:sporulation protein YlmC with PRC-barrel domain
MKSKTTSSIWTALIAANLSFLAGAADTPLAAPTAPSANPLASAERAANLYGRELVGADNQQVGKVDNVVVDLESEHILYVVVGASRGKVAVVPQIIGSSSGSTLHATVPKQKIDGAPQFTSQHDSPNELGQANFVYKVHQYFGVNPWWQGSTPADQGTFHNVHKLNQLIGMNVQDVNNQSIGKISNVVVDMPSGRLLYVVFEPASSLNLGNNLYAMPSDAFTLGSDQKHLVTNIDREKLSAAPHFDKNTWPNVKDAAFASQIYQYYGKQAWFNNAAPGYQPTGR